jgi:hypothetical protein
MLDFVEETLDQMPFLVEMTIIFTLLFAVLTGWDHRLGLFFGNLLQEIIRIIRAICDQSLKIKIGNQVIGLSNVMSLPASQEKAQGIAQGIYAGMDLGAESTSAASQRLGFLTTAFFRAPAAQGWARTTVLSNKIFSISGSPAKWRCISSKTP